MTDSDVSVNDQENASETALDADLSPEEELQAKLKEAIKVKNEDLGGLRRELTITIPRDTIDGELSDQYEELRTEAEVPGFRRGRAPKRLIEKRFGSEVGEKVGSSLIGSSYLAAVDKESLDVLGDPLLRVSVTEERTDDKGVVKKTEVEKLLPVDEAIEHLKLPKEGDLSFTCELELKPQFELPSLEKIPVEKPKVAIGDEEIDGEVKRMMTLRGTFRPVDGGKVEADDVVVGNLKVVVDGDTIKTEDNAELAARDQRYSGLLLTGFGDAAKGMKVNDTVKVEVEIPDDFEEVQARGKKGTFEFAVLDVKRLEVPELDEAFIKQIGFESEEEYRTFIRENMEQRLQSEIDTLMQAQISQYLLEKTEMEVPENTSQRQAERIISQRQMELYSRGVSEADIAKQADEIQTAAAAQAKDDLKHFFIMEKISEDRDINVTEEELNGAIAQIAVRRNQRFDRVRDEIMRTGHLQTLYIRLRDQKILQALLVDADVTEKDVPTEKKASDKKKAAKPKAKKKAAKKDTDKGKD